VSEPADLLAPYRRNWTESLEGAARPHPRLPTKLIASREGKPVYAHRLSARVQHAALMPGAAMMQREES
jgi:hypothetical protein